MTVPIYSFNEGISKCSTYWQMTVYGGGVIRVLYQEYQVSYIAALEDELQRTRQREAALQLVVDNTLDVIYTH